MDKKVLAIVLGIMIVIVGAIVFVASSSSDDPTAKRTDEASNNITNRSATPTNTPTNSTTEAGEYIDYTPEAITQNPGTKLLFFHAPWCPQCRALEADIKAKGVPSDVTIMKVDYDSNQSLRQKYGITLQTTIVKVDDVGNLIEKFVAYDEPTLDAVADKLL